jgi:hypothetical protein
MPPEGYWTLKTGKPRSLWGIFEAESGELNPFGKPAPPFAYKASAPTGTRATILAAAF